MQSDSNQPSAVFPYFLEPLKECLLLVIGIGLSLVAGLAGPTYILTLHQLQQLNVANVPALDRWSIGMHIKGADAISDYIQNGLVTVSVLLPLFFVRFHWRRFITLFVIYFETFALNWGITYTWKNVLSRPRPYVYLESFQTSGHVSASDMQSHISGHSSTVFMAAAFISVVFSHVFPKHKWRWAIWITLFAIAALGAIARVAAGVHFLSDVIHGAFWGTFSGLLVPILHTFKWQKK